MEIQRRRKEKPKVRKQVVRDCDFVIEEKKRYSGENYGKRFEDHVCTDHPYHNHVLKIRDKEEITSEFEEALALEEIQRDYDDILDIGDTAAADNTRDSGFLSVKDIDDEPDMLAIDSAVEEFGDYTIHTIRADIESLTQRTKLEDTDDLKTTVDSVDIEENNNKIETTPGDIEIEKDTTIEFPVVNEENESDTLAKTEHEVDASSKQVTKESPTLNKEEAKVDTSKQAEQDNPKEVKENAASESLALKNESVKEELKVPCLNEKTEDTVKINVPDTNDKTNKTKLVEKGESIWEIPKKKSSLESRTSSANKKREQEMAPIIPIARTESYSDIKCEWTLLEPDDVKRSQSVIKRRNKDETSSRSQSETSSRRQSLNGDYSDVKGEWEPLDPASIESQSQSVVRRRNKEQTSSRRQSLKSETFSDVDSYTPGVSNRSVREDTPSRRHSIRSDYSDIKDEWSPLEPGTIYERDMARRMYRHSSQRSRRSLQERSRKDSFASATSYSISRSQSFASTTRSISSTYTTDTFGPRRKLRRSMSASIIHSVRSFRRSFRSSLRSLSRSLRSLAMGSESKTKRRRTQSLTSLRSETKSERKERNKFKRYSLESLSSKHYYDPSKSKLANDVAEFERRKKLMQGFSKQADYMEKCFDIKDRKDEPYSGSTQQYRECLTLCTKLDLELQRQKPLQEDEDYKHLPYADQD